MIGVIHYANPTKLEHSINVFKRIKQIDKLINISERFNARRYHIHYSS